MFRAEVRAPNPSLQLSCVFSACSCPPLCPSGAEGYKVSESSVWLSETAGFLIPLSLLPPLKAEPVPGMTAPLATISHISINVRSPDLCKSAVAVAMSGPAVQSRQFTCWA